ncbi:DUF5819 family protein [Streptomyces sp. NPDC053367]|uniref:DUF5819 family protein n=1 Tax=Streptomyces sp. NPDC053367 TaxID=3365700 RepID=UPI0037D3C4A2
MTQHVAARRAVLLVGAALLGFHFLVASLSQAPLSPVKLRYYEAMTEYLHPYFTQNWMLFAPDPLTDDRGILARARCTDGTVTHYYDVTTPAIRSTQDSRFFPPRTARLISSTLQQLNQSDPVLSRIRETEKEKKKPVLPLLPAERTSRVEAERFLARYSLTKMPDVCDGRAEQIQIRVYYHEMPPWSQRKKPATEGKVSAQDLKWLKVSDLR